MTSITPIAEIPQLPAEANPHFVRALGDLADAQEIQVCEDIYTQNGTKLLAKGAKVSPRLYEQVINHRLRKPLELCLTSAEALDPKTLRVIAEQELDCYPLLRSFCNWAQGRITPLGMLEHLEFSPQASTLLAVAENRSAEMRQHQIRVTLIAMGICNAWRYNDQRLLANIATAGMFLDMGELYIDPTIGKTGKPMSARDWMAYSAHPIIGAALAREVAKLDPDAQKAILTHHERIDGFGYPRASRTNTVSLGGQILGLADTIAALLRRERPRQRLEIALKILPGEFAPDLVSLINSLLDDSSLEKNSVQSPGSEEDSVPNEIHQVFERIVATQDIYSSWTSRKFSPAARSTIEAVFERFMAVQKSFASTGMHGFLSVIATLSGEEIIEAQHEARCVLDEILWRLTRISRELALRCTKLPEDEAQELMHMADALMGNTPKSAPQASILQSA